MRAPLLAAGSDGRVLALLLAAGSDGRVLALRIACAFQPLVCIALLATGCGGDDGTDRAVVDTADVVVTTTRDLDFDADEYRAAPGEIEIAYVNEDFQRHTLEIEDRDDLDLTIREADDVAVATVELPAGEYVLFCNVAGHRDAGMEATLIVG